MKTFDDHSKKFSTKRILVILLIALFMFSFSLPLSASAALGIPGGGQSLGEGLVSEETLIQPRYAPEAEDEATRAASEFITAVDSSAPRAALFMASSGTGTSEDPIIISTAEELADFRDSVNQGQNYAGLYVQLGDDIDLDGIDWEPIGRHTGPSSYTAGGVTTNYGTWFAGTFDGAGYEIQNMTIGTADEPAEYTYAGFFGVVASTAVIKNLGFTDVTIYNVSDPDGYTGGDSGVPRGYVGVVAAQTQGSSEDYADNGVCTVIDNCYVDGGSIYSETKNSSIAYAAGIVAELQYGGAVTNCWTDVEVEAAACTDIETQAAYAGGIASTCGNYSLTMNCYALRDVTATSPNTNTGAAAGGISALPSGISYNCYASGDVAINNVGASAASYITAGALFGWIPGNGIALNCNYDENVSVTCYTYAQGTSVGVDNPFTGKITGFGAANGWCLDTTDYEGEDLVEQLNENLSGSVISAAHNLIEDKYASRDADKINTTTGKRYLGLGYDFISMKAAADGYYEWELSGNKAVLSDQYWISGEIDPDIFESGSGTETEPYIIKTEEQLRGFAVSLNSKIDYADVYLALDENITLADGQDWTPVGEGEYDFCGIFDGQGHTISNLTVGTAEDPLEDNGVTMYFALFGAIGNGGVVKNVGIEDVGIYVTTDVSAFAAGIAGYNENGIIDGCWVTGEIISQSPVVGNNFAGGLIGYDYRGIIVNSWTDVDVRSETKSYIAEAGGIVGLANRSTILNCYTLGDISGYASRTGGDEGMVAAGGIAGVQAGATANVFAVGDTISDTYSYYVGALHGWATGISRCYFGYYNTESQQYINGVQVNPVTPIGTLVGGGTNEAGQPYTGGVSYGNQGYGEAYLKSADFASLLNSNFAQFPVDTATVLPAGVTLKQWVFDAATSGLVKIGTEDASITYEEVIVEPPLPDYFDGTYQGRGGEDYIVTVVVENNVIAAVNLPGEPTDELNALVQAVLTDQRAVEVDDENDSAALQTAKLAIIAALEKAVYNDETGYGVVNSSIFAGGAGTESNPYKIATADQLMAFAAAVNEDESFSGRYIKLTRDIDLAGYSWIPAGGNGVWPFSGIFDGDNHVIRNMTTGTENDPAYFISSGLFANIEGGTVVNTGFKNAEIYLVSPTDQRIYAGTLTGYADMTASAGYIDNCWATGSITNITENWSYVGGLVGSINHGTLTNCWADMTIKSRSETLWSYAGGLVSLTARTGLFNNYAYGSIESYGYVNRSIIGGIAAMHAGTAYNNYADVDLTALVTTGDVGGFTGRHTGIAYAEYNYFNSDAFQKAGETVITDTKGIGTIVEGTRDGYGVATNITGLSEESLHSAELAAALNANLKDTTIMPRMQAIMDNWQAGDYPVTLPSNVTLLTWKYDSSANRVVLVQRSTGGSGGGGSSGGGSGGGSTSSDTETNDSSSGTTSTAVEATTNAAGTATAFVDSSVIKELVENAKDDRNAVIEIKVKAPDNATATDVNIPKDALDSIIADTNAQLRLSTSLAVLTFDADALSAIGAAGQSGDVSFQVSKVDDAQLPAGAKELVGDRPVYNFSVTVGGRSVSDFGGGTVNISIPYTPGAGEDPNAIVVYYIDNSGAVQTARGVYNAATRTVDIATGHFSLYAVGYNKISFHDVPETAWYYDSVTFISARGITQGTSGGAFSPDEAITRAQFIVMLMRAYGIEAAAGAADNFADAGNEYYSGYLAAAKALGITKGVGNNLFLPDAKITRQDMFTLLYRALDELGELPEARGSASLADFKDAAAVSDYAREAMDTLISGRVISGSGGAIQPQESATRAQMAQILYNLLSK